MDYLLCGRGKLLYEDKDNRDLIEKNMEKEK
jgi:hypothetical protein